MHIKYISKNVNQHIVVWIKEANRYIIFGQPAFEVFQQIAKNRKINEIANWFSKKYGITVSESIEFTDEINGNLQELTNIATDKFPKSSIPEKRDFCGDKTYIQRNYTIFNKNIRFLYSDEWMMDMIHPGIAHLQTKSNPKGAIQFQLCQTKDELVLIINKDKYFRWPLNQSAYFKGSVSLQLLNAVYNKTDEHWLGSFHAAAATKNNSAVLISASSGSGKSTLSALLVAAGFNLISDDLVPISFKDRKLYSFPSAISVKEGALNTLIPDFPQLENVKTQLNTTTGKESAYLVPNNENKPEIAKVKAIVFPEYNPSIDFEWEKVDNISVLNNLLTESWIADREEVVEAFLDWFFNIPCYRLRYNNNIKAIEKISQLLD